MTPLALAAITRLGIPLAELLLTAAGTLLARLAADTPLTPASVFQIAREIITTVDDGWPELSFEQRRVMALGDIDAELRARGGAPNLEDVMAVWNLARAGVS